jgi:hypothetical protein
MENTYEKLFLFLLRRLVVETAGLDDLVVDVELVPGACVHCLFDALLRDEPKDTNNFRLADTVGAVLRLKIGMRVPVAVIAEGSGV